ncbi:MAG: hypothetical protein IKW06_06660 [Clostridia bacterium]|nr:hypothetical protein [Clostridia bacterium]
MPENKKKNARPVSNAPTPKEPDNYDKFDLCNACSTMDCTGLIPTPPQSAAEIESYMSIYDYQPPIETDEDDENR